MANKVLGIINFEPSYVHVEGIENYRPASATSVLGRYRVIDFAMSNFANSGIQKINVYIKSKPRTLIEHINGTNYNINSKRGIIRLLPSERNGGNEIYNTDLRVMMDHVEYLESSSANYVVIAPSHFIYTQDFNKLVDEHIKSKNDITMLYQIVNNADKNFVMCDTLDIDKNGKVKGIGRNLGNNKRQLISLETYVMSRKLFIDLIYAGLAISSAYSLRDAIVASYKNYKVGAYCHGASAYCISSLMAYYNSTMHIRKENEVKALITDEWPIHTMTSDSCPTLYADTADVKGSIIGNGCKIEGKVINSVIGRNVVIKKGAVIKDSIILPNATINKDVHLDKCVVDRYAIVTHAKDLHGEDNNPLYVARRDRI
ncbi:MAG: glucose-1-phosphate adenylyltransferase subunit GlgD [Erysipelotrichaceae bacterium]|nr:glucose-1-phosphate adenylyltransferase subunit GlgD [Erysipelotrichaceae bacterium]